MGSSLPDAIREHGIDLDRATRRAQPLKNAAAYLELHIEQGPVLESLDLPLGVVLGTFGVERHAITFTRPGRPRRLDADGQPPRRARRRRAAELAIREIAMRSATARSARWQRRHPARHRHLRRRDHLPLDQRHLDAGIARPHAAGGRGARRAHRAEEQIDVAWERIWHIQPFLSTPS